MNVDFDALLRDGFVVLGGVVPETMCARFEADLEIIGRAGLNQRGRSQGEPDAIADLLRLGGAYRQALFSNLKHLRVVQEMGHHVVSTLETAGVLDWLGYEALVAYPTIRADVPDEDTYLLPMHQDYATPCRRAFRVWATLRPASATSGSLLVVPGSHLGGLIAHDTSDPARPFVPDSAYDSSGTRLLELEAGDGILFDPLLVHGSVPAKNARMKYNLLVNLWDLTTLADPDDPEDPIAGRVRMRHVRDTVRG
ncbi:phytanoyl-CoA dioxygenase family protein [Phenylobacterium sp. LH3H17]|uniref:phytanoyl-CoA dioxygenase family protein n=1 Tax=Phenylobacterium sp. LH3H17 TaxID=2903901 RepID=UPI0020C974F3|nr:phytanoyl-CoA dioxygenase family protein [Phenylobacterium sp. LH3H17]UTP40364.1 phytanoyl-CoA dioxygenase family protein [Phenylobacterium sp. LH3H17]